MTINKKIIAGFAVLVLIIAASYGIEYSYKSVGTKSGAIVKISNNNQPAAYFGSDVLQKLPGGTKKNSAEGPTLTSVLIAAGISDFSKVEIIGVNSNTPYIINKAEVNNNLVFYYTNHNTVNLVKKDNQQVLVEDVSTISTQS